MKVNVLIDDIAKVKTDGIIVNLFEGVTKPEGATGAVDKALDVAISKLIKQGDIKGKLNDINIIHSLGKMPARVIAVLGMGKKSELDIDKVRNIMGQACRVLSKHNCNSVATAVHGAGDGKLSLKQAGQAVVEGAVLGLYSFRRHITKEPDDKQISELIVVDRNRANLEILQKSCLKGKIVAEATNVARDMINEPGNYMKPSDMTKMAEKIAKQYHLEIGIMDRSQMEKLGMGALLGVAQGSVQPPKFITLRYRGNKQSRNTMGFVGKGITFDSGGISIKPSENMREMKSDMSGGAAVMAALSAIAQLNLKVNITAIVAAVENMPGGRALKPGDILKAINGKTIEVVSTDAEGRLTLADALGYAAKQKLSPIVDVATLTGSCHVALGDVCSGIFTNNQEFVNRIIEAGNLAGECLWQLPMKEDYREQNKSEVADIQNSGTRYGGAITAAMFLSEFVGDIPWAHIDIAGTALSEKEKGYTVKGATGVTVRTLVALAESYSK